MKNLLLICFAILLCACNQGKKKQQTTEIPAAISENKPEDFDWLLGQWKRLNEDGSQDTFEYWEKTNSTEYSGIGFTMQDGDTISQEKIQFIKVDEGWNLNVKSPDEEGWTTFEGVQHDPKSFTCENTEIEFPNTIKYWVSSNSLHAMVSGSDVEIAFEFEKIEE